MKLSRRVLIACVLSIPAFAGPALAGGALNPQQYKDAVGRATDRWVAKVAPFDLDINLARTTVAVLSAQVPRTPDVDQKIADLTVAIKALLAKVDIFNSEYRAELMLLEKEVTATKSEGPQLPAIVKQLIVAKGIPISKTVSVLPDAKWDQKNDKLGNITLTVTVRNLAPLSN
jgi:hypothetical protein